MYAFVRDHTEGLYPTRIVCSLLGVSRSAYYAYKSGQTYVLSAEKDRISDEVSRVFKEHLSRYGSRRIVAELRDEGLYVGRYSQ